MGHTMSHYSAAGEPSRATVTQTRGRPFAARPPCWSLAAIGVGSNSPSAKVWWRVSFPYLTLKWRYHRL